MAKALFLDRDGTINVDTGYVYERAKFTFLDGVFDFCRRAQEKGYLIIVITNQSGIARGYYTEADYERLTAWMRGEFAAHGVTVTDVFHCPALDGPDRKPAPGLFLKAREKYAIDMAASVNIGDKPRDLEAGERAGVGTNILFTGDWRTMALPPADAAKTPEQLAAEQTFGVAFTAFERLSVGNSSRNYRATTAVGERYFVKFASPKVIDLAITRDRLMKSPCVPVLAFGGVRGELGDQAFCAFEWLDGLESFPPHTYTEGQIRSICDFHARLMDDFAALPRDRLKTRAGFDTWAHGAPPRVIHGDFHCRNFGFRDGRACACFDFESMRLGLAAEDLLRIFVHALERTRFWRLGRIGRTLRNLTTCVRLSGLGRDEFLAALDLYVAHKQSARRRKKRLAFLARLEEMLRAPLYRLLRRAIRRAPCAVGERVSVIVPVYNVEKYLARCLDSIIAQTARDLEIICVNDGSTDASAAILADYAAKDPRIRVLTQPNGGLSAARNAGLDAATGDWVMFVDSDDFIPPYAVEGFLKVAAESGASVVVSSSYAVDELSAPRPAAFRWTLERPALAHLVGRRKIQSSAWNKFYRRDVIGARRFIAGIYFEDWPFVTELFGDLDAFALVDAPLYVYCKNGASIVRSAFTEKKVASYLTGIAHVAAHFRDHPQRRVAQRRIATAVKMLVGKAMKSGAAAVRAHAVRGVSEMAARGIIDRSRLDWKTRFRLGLRPTAIGRVWLAALGYWLVTGIACGLVNPSLRADTLTRYAPMADAFARGDWFEAFHPRFGVLFQVVSGSLAFLFGIDGVRAASAAAFLFLALAAVAVWYCARRLWDARTAWYAFAFVLLSEITFRYSFDGLRESIKCLGFALVALGIVERRSRWYGLGLFVLITGFSYCFATASVLAFAWCAACALRGAWRRLPGVIGGWLAGTLAVTVMVHAYTGHWLPTPHFIKYLGGFL